MRTLTAGVGDDGWELALTPEFRSPSSEGTRGPRNILPCLPT